MTVVSRFFYFLSLGCFFCSTLTAQVKVITASPDKTIPGTNQIHSPHIALYNPARDHSEHRLILMIEGTGASATSMRQVDSVFATMGFHVISIDYPNNVISTICLHSKDTLCADHFREEIITGDPVSDVVKVDEKNSILNRFTGFLKYLAKTDPNGGWNKFIKRGKPLWKDIIVAGHSQGAGHAAYLGKIFKVSRVLIFSGPQDYLEDLDMPAPWLSMKSATPSSRYYAFLNLNDPFKINNQILNCEKLMNHTQADTLMVRPGVPIDSRHQILVNNIATKDPHGSTLLPEFRNVWAYMLNVKFPTDER